LCDICHSFSIEMNISTLQSRDSSYPPYIERGGEQAFEQPYHLDDTKLFGFVLEGTAQNLQALCDKYLNQPANNQVKYHPASNSIILTFDSIGNITSPDRPDRQKGSFSEAGEVIVWILTQSKKGLAWFIPYIFVNSSPAMVSGREVYGFPKKWGWFQLPPDPRDPQILTLETLAIQTFSPQSRATRQQLLEVKQIPGDYASTGSFINRNPLEILTEIVQSTIPEIADLLQGEMPVVFLKQFRDVQDGKKACYQAIVEAKVKLNKLYGVRPLGHKFQVSVQNFDSHPLVTDLGIQAVQTAKVACWLNFDFSLENGTEIWKAT
jgi:hypothetical protein